jgi:hypothetical protein
LSVIFRVIIIRCPSFDLLQSIRRFPEMNIPLIGCQVSGVQYQGNSSLTFSYGSPKIRKLSDRHGTQWIPSTCFLIFPGMTGFLRFVNVKKSLVRYLKKSGIQKALYASCIPLSVFLNKNPVYPAPKVCCGNGTKLIFTFHASRFTFTHHASGLKSSEYFCMAS